MNFHGNSFQLSLYSGRRLRLILIQALRGIDKIHQ